MTNATGGPAFPTENARQVGVNAYHYEGMTLRDYLAAKAMEAMINGKWPGPGDRSEIAKRAYLMADEMLKKRET